jgi:hypothetical protein
LTICYLLHRSCKWVYSISRSKEGQESLSWLFEQSVVGYDANEKIYFDCEVCADYLKKTFKEENSGSLEGDWELSMYEFFKVSLNSSLIYELEPC